MGQWNNNARIQGPLPAGYDTIEVAFYVTYDGEVWLQIDGVTKAKATMPCTQCAGYRSATVVYMQKYSPGQIFTLIVESGYGGVGKDSLKITLRLSCDTYVKTECNASRDVCQQHLRGELQQRQAGHAVLILSTRLLLSRHCYFPAAFALF